VLCRLQEAAAHAAINSAGAIYCSLANTKFLNQFPLLVRNSCAISFLWPLPWKPLPLIADTWL
jgi:hypothetical protein